MASVNASHDDDEDAAVDSINITPLVDVLMVVLVMFILTATAQVSGIQINLPKASASVSLSEAKTKAISVNDGGQVFLDAYPVTLADIALAERQNNTGRVAELRNLRSERFEFMERLSELPPRNTDRVRARVVRDARETAQPTF